MITQTDTNLPSVCVFVVYIPCIMGQTDRQKRINKCSGCTVGQLQCGSVSVGVYSNRPMEWRLLLHWQSVRATQWRKRLPTSPLTSVQMWSQTFMNCWQSWQQSHVFIDVVTFSSAHLWLIWICGRLRLCRKICSGWSLVSFQCQTLCYKEREKAASCLNSWPHCGVCLLTLWQLAHKR